MSIYRNRSLYIPDIGQLYQALLKTTLFLDVFDIRRDFQIYIPLSWSSGRQSFLAKQIYLPDREFLCIISILGTKFTRSGIFV